MACAQEQARASCCLSLLPLDDLTMPPYSLHPPSPMTPLLGHSNIFQAKSKCWLWLVLLFLPFVFFSSFSVLLLRDTEQVNRAHHTTLHIRERFFFSPFRRSRPLVLLCLLCVHQPHRYISAREVSDLAGSLSRPRSSFSRDYSDL